MAPGLLGPRGFFSTRWQGPSAWSQGFPFLKRGSTQLGWRSTLVARWAPRGSRPSPAPLKAEGDYGQDIGGADPSTQQERPIAWPRARSASEWPRCSSSTAPWTNTSLHVVATEHGVIGLDICADNAFYSLALGRALAAMGAGILLSPCAWVASPGFDNTARPYGDEWVIAYGAPARGIGMPVIGVGNVGPVVGGERDGWRCIGAPLAMAGCAPSDAPKTSTTPNSLPHLHAAGRNAERCGIAHVRRRRVSPAGWNSPQGDHYARSLSTGHDPVSPSEFADRSSWTSSAPGTSRPSEDECSDARPYQRSGRERECDNASVGRLPR